MPRAFSLITALVLAGPVHASNFEFLSAPQTDLNRIYRIEKLTGEVTACQYGLKEGTVGVTLCYPAGEGASAAPAGDYGLVASRHEREGGVFRINRRTGEMSVCYVFNDEVVCTPPAQATRKSAARPSNIDPKETGSIPPKN